MTKPASDSVRKIPNPAAVIGQIENATQGSRRDDVLLRDPSKTPQLRVVHADKEVFDDQLDQPLEVPLQIAELTGHLKRRSDELQTKEKRLNKKIANWQAGASAQRALDLSDDGRVKNRQQQLHSLQFHLLQMQNDIVDSQLLIKKIIEHFENTDSDNYMKLALELLRMEVLDRFDYIGRRWEMLHDKLEDLYRVEPSRKAA